MMRSQQQGNRYLAGLVIAFASLHFGLTCAATAIFWSSRNHAHLVANFMLLGLLPAAAALFCGFRAWSAPGSRSATLSACGLLILLLGLGISHLVAGAF